METEPRPRISLKVAFFLTDTRAVGRGNFSVIPGSHRQNKVEYPAEGIADPAGATPVCVGPGAAVFFDRPGAPWADGSRDHGWAGAPKAWGRAPGLGGWTGCPLGGRRAPARRPASAGPRPEHPARHHEP